jgi:hypothetical protein
LTPEYTLITKATFLKSLRSPSNVLMERPSYKFNKKMFVVLMIKKVKILKAVQINRLIKKLTQLRKNYLSHKTHKNREIQIYYKKLKRLPALNKQWRLKRL